MGHSNFFRFVPMKSPYRLWRKGQEDGGDSGMEGRGVSGTQPLHLSRGKWLWPKSTYIYGTTLVPVKKTGYSLISIT